MNRPPVSFEHPPVVEVVCGVRFEPIPGLSSGHIGQLWTRFGDEFPLTADRHALPAVQTGPGPQVTVSAAPTTPRVWFVSTDETRLIQVQQDRLIFNWRRGESAAYPRYPAVYEEFCRHLATFEDYLREANTGPICPMEYELSYLNRIQEDEVSSHLRDLGRVLPDLAWRADPSRFLPAPDHVAGNLRFMLPEGGGSLQVTIDLVRRVETGARVLALDLRARAASGVRPRDEWFALAHEWITQGFVDLTGPEMHDRIWKRRFDG